MRYAHFAEICKKCGNKQNMQQSHFHIKLTCLAVCESVWMNWMCVLLLQGQFQLPQHGCVLAMKIMLWLLLLSNQCSLLVGHCDLSVMHTKNELIPVLGSQPAGDMSHKPGGRLPLLSARPTVTLAVENFQLKKYFSLTSFCGQCPSLIATSRCPVNKRRHSASLFGFCCSHVVFVCCQSTLTYKHL